MGEGPWQPLYCTPDNSGLPRGWYLWHPTHGTDDATRCSSKTSAKALADKRNSTNE